MIPSKLSYLCYHFFSNSCKAVALQMINVFNKIIMSFLVLNLQHSFGQLVSLTNSEQEEKEHLDFNEIIEENQNAKTYTDICPLRIYGGRDVSITTVPYQIALRLPTLNGLHWYAGCGGSLITLKHVLSAAHCFLVPEFYKMKTKLRAVAGSSKATVNSYTMLSEDWRRIKRYFVHANYNKRTFRHDFAVLEVTSPFIESNRVQTIRMHSPSTKVKLKEGLLCLATGYGYIAKGKRPQKLQKACLPIVSRKTCSYYYTKEYLHKGTFCAGEDNIDTCQGDSGGPIVCHGILVGLTSFGLECGKAPGVFTRISSYTSGDKVPLIQPRSASGNTMTLTSTILSLTSLTAISNKFINTG